MIHVTATKICNYETGISGTSVNQIVPANDM